MKTAEATRIQVIPDAHYKPYPELLDERPGSYEIVDSRRLPGAMSSGMTDKVERVVYVPLEEDGRSISLHELLHVKFSPERIDCETLGVETMIVWAVEDACVNTCAALIGVPVVHSERLVDEVVKRGTTMLEDGELAAFVLHAIAGSGTNVEGRLDAVVGDGVSSRKVARLVSGTRQRLESARVGAGAIIAPFSDVVKISRWLAQELERHGLGPIPSVETVGCCMHADGRPRRRRRGTRGVHLRDGVMPGRMRIATPPLLLPCADAKSGRRRRKRPASEGAELYRIERFVSDQRVFARRTRRILAAGGTMLVDTSGSMRLSGKDLDGLLARAPAGAMVAIYSGNTLVGELRIVARDGRRAAASHLEPYGHGNVIDFPALQWLAKQRPPRAWISDGQVTGSGDLHTEVLAARCAEICEQGRITRVGDIKAAMSWLDQQCHGNRGPG